MMVSTDSMGRSACLHVVLLYNFITIPVCSAKQVLESNNIHLGRSSEKKSNGKIIFKKWLV